MPTVSICTLLLDRLVKLTVMKEGSDWRWRVYNSTGADAVAGGVASTKVAAQVAAQVAAEQWLLQHKHEPPSHYVWIDRVG